MTSLALPLPSAPMTRRLIRLAPGATPRNGVCNVESCGYGELPAMMAPMCVPCPNESSLDGAALAVADEIFRKRDAAGERAMAGPDARVDERDADAGAGERRMPGNPRPHLVGADRLVRDRHERRHLDVARQMIDIRAERLDLRGGRPHHGAIGQPFLDAQPMARGDRVNFVGGHGR